MSIIVAVEKGGKKCVAENSHSLLGSRIINESASPGIRNYWDSLIGITGWTVYHNILTSFTAAHDPMPLDSPANVFRMLCKLWRYAKEELQFVNDQGAESSPGPFVDLDCSMLIVNENGIFNVTSELEVDLVRHYTAIGSGNEYAFGALSVLYDSERSTEEIARQATQAAIFWDQSCPGEVQVFNVA